MARCQRRVGSNQLPTLLAAHRSELACDFVVSGDGVQWSETEPTLLTGLRGSGARGWR